MTRSTFGPAFVEERDGARLRRQRDTIRDLMLDGRPRTLGDIATLTGYPEGSISAQLRHLKKPRYGAYRLEKRYLGGGLYAYKLLPPLPQGQQQLFDLGRPARSGHAS